VNKTSTPSLRFFEISSFLVPQKSKFQKSVAYFIPYMDEMFIKFKKGKNIVGVGWLYCRGYLKLSLYPSSNNFSTSEDR
jgi:hypothetical protein